MAIGLKHENMFAERDDQRETCHICHILLGARCRWVEIELKHENMFAEERQPLVFMNLITMPVVIPDKGMSSVWV